MHLVQMCVQGRWVSDCSLLTLPHLEETHILQMNKTLAQSTGARDSGVQEVACLAELLALCERDNKFLSRALGKALSSQQITQVSKYAVYTVYYNTQVSSVRTSLLENWYPLEAYDVHLAKCIVQ